MGATTAGTVASVSMPVGKTQKRAGSLFKGKKTSKPFYEDEIVEQDLILVPGQIQKKDKSFIPHDKDRRDHEVEMARSELFAAAKDAQRIYKMIQGRTEDEGLMGWQQSYITLAADYLNSVADSLEHHAATEGAGVLAGGMSNFEEDVAEGAPELLKKEMPTHRHAEKLLAQNGVNKDDPDYHKHLANTISHLRKFGNIDQINKQGVAEGHADQQRKVFKKNGKPVGEVGIDRESSPGVGQWYMKCYAYDIDYSGYDSYEEAVAELKHCLKQGVAEGDGNPDIKPGMKVSQGTVVKVNGNTVIVKAPNGDLMSMNIHDVDHSVAEGKCPKCGGPAFSEEHIAEAKDACYHKVKSRYKVWPSAYASGALVKCRKVGASNWGNKSK